MKKIVSVLLALALTLTLVGSAVAEDKVNLTAFQYTLENQSTDFNNLWFFQQLEEKTNTHVDFTMVKDGDFQTQLNLMFISGKYMDMILRGSTDIEDYGVNQGLLMPLDDFRRQVDGQPISFDLLGHCADRYGVSLTAAALRWTEIANKRAILVASRDDYMLWAKSNQAAFKSGAYFATRKRTIEMPRGALAYSDNCSAASETQTTRAQAWFPREPSSMPLTEMTKVTAQYDYTLTLLLMPDAEWQRPRHDDEESEEDTFDHFIRNGQPPVRN